MFTAPTLLRLLKGWLLSFLVFGLLAALLVGQFAWSTSFTWQDAAWSGLRSWLPWAVVAPPLFFLVARLPLFATNWKIAVPVHLVTMVAVIVLCAFASEWLSWLRPPPEPGSRGRGRGPRTSERSSSPVVVPATPGPRLSTTVNEDAAEATAPVATPRPRTEGSRSDRGRSGSRSRNPFESGFFLAFRLPIYLAIYLAILSVAHALHFYRRSQARERRSLELESGLTKARLDALRMQLQPHFLFNSLNAIAALIHKDPEAADEMVAALSDFLRLTLERPTEQEMPLRRELEFVERYLAIEKVRFGDRLHFSFDIPADTHAALVPALMLQPLVENAVRHGLEPKLAGGKLTITARRENGHLRLSVADNGAGLGEHPTREGIGLHNTRARLGELYGSNATLELHSEEGVEVLVSLPYHTVSA